MEKIDNLIKGQETAHSNNYADFICCL